jgi:hypothetical protein
VVMWAIISITGAIMIYQSDDYQKEVLCKKFLFSSHHGLTINIYNLYFVYKKK